MKLLPFASAALLATLALSFAQSSLSSGGKDLITSAVVAAPQTTEITSESMEMWSTDTETRGTFSGNVVVTGTNLKLTCDRLEITASRIGDKTATIGTLEKFKYLLASGKVRIVQGDREATCGRAEVFPREDRIDLTERPMVIDHGTEATYVGDKLQLFRGERRVKGDGVQITLPGIKDLGFDKNQPAPKAETNAEQTPTTPANEQKPTANPLK